jgi:uncharacterized protein YeeX (DUF496 family)
MQSVAHYVNWQEITYLYAVWNQLHRELEDVEKLLPQARQKRGLLNLGGHVLNFLFGTATSTELRDLHEVVENIRERQATITHSVEHQLTFTKDLDENVRQNTKDVATLAKILKVQVSDLLRLNNTVKQFEGNLTHRFEYMTQISQTVRELEFFSLQMEQEIIKMRQGLDVTSTGKLSAALLPPHNLSLLLQQVALKLPTEVALLAGTRLEDMFVYYHVARVQAYAFRDKVGNQITPEGN